MAKFPKEVQYTLSKPISIADYSGQGGFIDEDLIIMKPPATRQQYERIMLKQAISEADNKQQTQILASNPNLSIQIKKQVEELKEQDVIVAQAKSAAELNTIYSPKQVMNLFYGYQTPEVIEKIFHTFKKLLCDEKTPRGFIGSETTPLTKDLYEMIESNDLDEMLGLYFVNFTM